MPTHDEWSRFLREYRALPATQKAAFLELLPVFVHGVASGVFLPALRVKTVKGKPGVFEMTFAADGRATFHYGTPVKLGDRHVIWRRIGGHEILNDA